MIEVAGTTEWPPSNWYVVNTKPRKEEFARRLLEQGGFTVLVPRVLEWSRSRGRMKERVSILFPGYIFVRMSAGRDHASVRWTPGVKRVIGAHDGPAPVDDALVSELASRMGDRGYIVQRPGLAAGDRIEVRGGPFAGLMGLVEGPSSAAERVRVLLTVFSRRTTVEIDERNLVRLGHGC
ncbi:MAG TPA: transcription termination/antitermination NusG family protein [Candidatus Polarisedimenticolia bacterium]|jgi:transcriptional antiterminator RfaH